MKTSNKILVTLLLAMTVAIVSIDLLLKQAYLKINLADPLKNYVSAAVRPFKYLKITGGNGYAIKIKQAPGFDLKVMTKRKNFLTVIQNADTLLIRFTVASSVTMRDPEGLPLGMIISSPQIKTIIADGSNNIITNWKADSLKLVLMGHATANINGADIGKLTAIGNHNAIVNFHSANNVHDLDLRLNNNAAAFLQGINYSVLNPQLTGESQLIFNASSAAKLKSYASHNPK